MQGFWIFCLVMPLLTYADVPHWMDDIYEEELADQGKPTTNCQTLEKNDFIANKENDELENFITKKSPQHQAIQAASPDKKINTIPADNAQKTIDHQASAVTQETKNMFDESSFFDVGHEGIFELPNAVRETQPSPPVQKTMRPTKSKKVLSQTELKPSEVAPVKHPIDSSDKFPCKESCCQLSVDWLYWDAKEEGLAWGVTSQPDDQITTLYGLHGKVTRINPEYSSGVRVGIDYQAPKYFWDVGLKYTYYQNNSHNFRPAGADIVWDIWLDPTGGVGGPFQLGLAPFSTGDTSAKWHLNLNAFDLELGRCFLPAPKFSVRPFAGIKAAWVDQDFNILYNGVLFSMTNSSIPVVLSKNDNDLWGVGLRLGADLKWLFTKNFSIYGMGSITELACHVHSVHKETLPDGTVRSHLTDTTHPTNAVFELSLGMAYTLFFKNDRAYVEIHAAWEEQIWDNQMLFNRLVGPNNGISVFQTDSYLGLSGLTLGIKVGF